MNMVMNAPSSSSSGLRSAAPGARMGAEPVGTAHSSGGEYLTFRLGGEEYGIDILRVQEIRSYEQPTRIANAPHFIKGVVNLRGVIVPIVDLRLKFGCDSAEYNDFTVVIVLIYVVLAVIISGILMGIAFSTLFGGGMMGGALSGA